ncbi:AEC family transporter [Sulfurospirillum arcachonense]|uniref:AEC family transporter n=1 Tax=Sulfurospirillum arcachonense TaxID=57666 RepID=UPI0004692429|nr:AEC family transporter [Sulfurospirillum arcachonense]
MEHIVNTLIPIFSLILLGFYFKKTKFPSIDFWPMADKFTYYVLMPSLLVYKLSSANINLEYTLNLVITALLSVLVVFVSLVVFNKIVKFESRAFTSIMQGGIRFNSYVFLAFIDSLYGDKGLVLAAIVMAFVIPFINILCISTFAIYTRKGNFSFKSFLKTIVKNPLILACALGGLINGSGLELPLVSMKFLAILSNAALPVGLLSVGVGLEFKYLRSAKKELVVAVFGKLFYFPLVIYGIGFLFGLSGMMLSIAVVFGAMPTAVSGYILARELGGDTTLMASIITLQTLLCMLTLFLVIPIL